MTEAGSLLLGRARQILAMVDDAKAEICDDGETGRIRIAAIPTIAPYFLPELLRKFQTAAPRARVLVQEDTTNQLLKRLAEGDVDIVFAALPIESKYLQVDPVLEEELWLVMSSDNPLSQQESIDFCDIEDLPFVLLGEAHCLSDNVISFCRQKSFHPLSVERTSQLTMVQELVSLNHGISLIPEMARRLDQSPRRVYRSLNGEKPKRQVVMVTNPYRFQSQLQKRFQAMMNDSRQSTVGSFVCNQVRQ